MSTKCQPADRLQLVFQKVSVVSIYAVNFVDDPTEKIAFVFGGDHYSIICGRHRWIIGKYIFEKLICIVTALYKLADFILLVQFHTLK
jgi:hypothetical protein